MKEKIIIKYYEKCPVCSEPMNAEVKSCDINNGLLTVEYKCQKHHKTITKSIRDQEWFWTKEWQKKEKEADEDIKKGRLYGPFTNAEDLIRSLRSKK